MSKVFAALVLQLLISSLAHSDEIKCGNLKPLWGTTHSNCICGKALSKLNLPSPYDGLKITQVCNYRESGSGAEREVLGLFVFSGNYIGDGIVTLEKSDDSYELYFEGGKISSAPPFSFNEGPARLRFEKIGLAAKSFRFDSVIDKDLGQINIDAENFCFQTKAKISITELFVLIDEGTDFMGEFPVSYKVLNHAKPTKCSLHRAQ
jgi:hypothetical protein